MKFTNIKDELAYSSKRYKLKNDIEKMVIDKGYMNYEPEIVEDYDKFVSMNSRSNRKSTVKVINANGRISILRPDITSTLLTNLLPKWEDDLKLKIFYYEKIFRQSGISVKEIRQMGIECLGIDTIDADKEVIMLANDIMKKYRDKYVMEIGSSEYLKGLLQEFYLNDEEYMKIMYFLDRKNKQELERYIKNFKDNDAYDVLLNLIDLKGDMRTVLETIEKGFLNERMEKGLKELKEIYSFLEEKKFTDNIICDLSMVSSLGYYSGVTLRGYFRDSNREIIKGGRYDTYTERFGEVIPAIGFSIEIDELLKVLYKGGEI
jgi:ATP phosphoribosyltransferase regulatory subunit